MGIDLAPGDVASISKGLGPRAIREFILSVVAPEPGITTVFVAPEQKNHQSVRAFEKAGFTALGRCHVRGEIVWRQVMRISLSDLRS